ASLGVVLSRTPAYSILYVLLSSDPPHTQLYPLSLHDALPILNITVNQGEIYGFLGRNGAGKTTTIRMLLGLIKPTFGQVEIFGENLFNNQKSILRRIGSIVEVPGFYENLTARENLLINA